MNELTAVTLAQARAHTASLFSHVAAHGVTAVTLPTLRAIPDLASTLPNPFDFDLAASRHYALFGLNIYPHQSLFLGASGLLGGDESECLQESYAAGGYSLNVSLEPDHLSQQLGYLAHLFTAEAEAWQDQLPMMVERIRTLQTDFLHQHLLRWLLPFTIAIRRSGDPFYTALTDLTLEFVLDSLPNATLAPAFTLPAVPEEPPNGWKPLVHTLLIPAQSGLVLSREAIHQLARAHRWPHGFGDRFQMLVTLIESAASYDSETAVLQALYAHLAEWSAAYRAYTHHPILGHMATVWAERTAVTQIRLQQILTLATS